MNNQSSNSSENAEDFAEKPSKDSLSEEGLQTLQSSSAAEIVLEATPARESAAREEDQIRKASGRSDVPPISTDSKLKIPALKHSSEEEEEEVQSNSQGDEKPMVTNVIKNIYSDLLKNSNLAEKIALQDFLKELDENSPMSPEV